MMTKSKPASKKIQGKAAPKIPAKSSAVKIPSMTPQDRRLAKNAALNAWRAAHRDDVNAKMRAWRKSRDADHQKGRAAK